MTVAHCPKCLPRWWTSRPIAGSRFDFHAEATTTHSAALCAACTSPCDQIWRSRIDKLPSLLSTRAAYQLCGPCRQIRDRPARAVQLPRPAPRSRPPRRLNSSTLYGFHAPFLRLQCHMAMPCGLHVITCLVMYGTPCHGSYATTWLPCHSALTPHDISTMCFGSHATAPLASMHIAVPPAHRLPRHMAPMP